MIHLSEIKHFDSLDLEDRLLGNQENIKQVLEMTKEYLSNLPAQLETLATNLSLVKLQKMGHGIKGVASSASMYKLAYYGKELQNLNSLDEDIVTQILRSIKAEVVILILTIDNFLSK